VFSLSSYSQEQAAQTAEIISKKDTLALQLGKLQKDCRDLMQKDKDWQRIKEQNETVQQEKDALKQQIQEVL
jgi:seryl-tRNA synthetase